MNKVTMEQREAIVREAVAKRDAIASGDRHTRNTSGWINELLLLADHHEPIPRFARDAMRTIAHGLRAADRTVAKAYVDMIERVENRCMAADGPVTPTHKEITDDELRAVYLLALDALGEPPR